MVEILTLDNGVRLVADPVPGLESAALGVWFRAGAVDETPEEHGVAHLLEHMAFKGTTTRSARAIAEEIEKVGGYLNASTGYSRTGYYARILKQDVGVAIDILADILTNPLLDAGELAKERDVVIQEIGEAADVPDDAVMEMLQALAFGGHALGRPILGTVESVSGHSSERLRAFMGKHYVATTLVVAASGAIEPDELATLARDRFGARPAAAQKPRDPKPRYVGGVGHDPRDIEQTHVALAFPGAAAVDPDYFATRVFVEALGGGMSSRIFQSVREERGLAYSVYSFTDSYDDVGSVGAYVGADAASAPEAVGIIRDEIEAMASGATVEEVDRARALLKSTMLMALESPSARTETAVGQLYAHGRLLPTEELKARLDAVTVDEVRKAAAKALSGAPSLAIVGAADFDRVQKAIAAGAH
jgi:predicted Zn-dependent peptidase